MTLEHDRGDGLTQPLILTALLPRDMHRWATDLRTQHFPPERNYLAAHVTLFHAIPAQCESEVAGLLKRLVAEFAPVEAYLLGLMSLGRGTALVRYLAAIPSLEARGRVPLLDGTPDAVAALARAALADLPSPRLAAAQVPPAARPALIEAWQTEPLLRQIAANPGRVARGAVGLSEFRKRLRLLRWA